MSVSTKSFRDRKFDLHHCELYLCVRKASVKCLEFSRKFFGAIEMIFLSCGESSPLLFLAVGMTGALIDISYQDPSFLPFFLHVQSVKNAHEKPFPFFSKSDLQTAKSDSATIWEVHPSSRALYENANVCGNCNKLCIHSLSDSPSSHIDPADNLPIEN